MAEEARVTAVVGEVMTTVVGGALVTAVVGEVMYNYMTPGMLTTAMVGEVMVSIPFPSTGRKYGPAAQIMG